MPAPIVKDAKHAHLLDFLYKKVELFYLLVEKERYFFFFFEKDGGNFENVYFWYGLLSFLVWTHFTLT